MAMLAAGSLRHQIRFERPVADDSFDGAGSGGWSPVATVRAQVQDVLPSRGEKIADGINITARPARVRIRYRDDLAPSMRVLIGRMIKGQDGNPEWQTDRITQIITAFAEIGWREGLEFMVEDYTTAGNPA